MNALRRFWQTMVGFVSAREGAEPVALVRILTGLTIAAHLLAFRSSGAPAFAVVSERFGGMAKSDGWLESFGGASPQNVDVTLLVCVGAAVFVTLGLFTRPAIFVCWLAFRVITQINGETHGAYDAVMINSLFLLFWSGSHRAFSLDNKLWKRPRTDVSRWPRMLMVVNLGLMYFGSGIHKLSSGWVPGGDASALWFILHQPMWARFPSLPMWAYPITQIATTTVWLWEITGFTLPLAVFLAESNPSGPRLAKLKRAFAKVRWLELYVLFGVAMHIGIEVSMEVGAFTFASLAIYPAIFPPDRWRAWRERLRTRFGR